MRTAPLPENEPERLEALRRLDVLDTPPEPRLDELTRLAARLCSAPLAAISLIDENRQWFKSRLGFDAEETSRDVAFCSHAILQKELFEIPDALLDERFKDNPFVTNDPNVRFYAGMPLTTPKGRSIGTLCVIDRVPRTLSEEQREILAVLSRQVMTQILLKWQLDRLRSEAADRARIHDSLQKRDQYFRAVFNSIPNCLWLLTPEGVFLEANRAALDLGGGVVDREVVGRSFREAAWWEEKPDIQTALQHALRRASAGDKVQFLVESNIKPDSPAALAFSITPVLDKKGEVEFLLLEGRVAELTGSGGNLPDRKDEV